MNIAPLTVRKLAISDKQNPWPILVPFLQHTDSTTLWFVDESVQQQLSFIKATPNLCIVTNRFDVYQQAKVLKHSVFFTDFDIQDFPAGPYDQIIYRIAKEKAQVHHIINLAAEYLSRNGQLIVVGTKQEGIKTYASKLIKELGASGSLKKKGNIYLGCFCELNSKVALDDQTYHSLQKIHCSETSFPYYYTKPGVFGWNKIDRGTQLLLQTLSKINSSLPKISNVLDLGCGYGWIFLNLDQYNFTSIVATDNNAAAILAAKANQALIETPCSVVVSDCANTIDEQFDLVLCNPPFHQGFEHTQDLTKKFLSVCANKLKPSAQALVVVNEFIAVEKVAKSLFKEIKTLTHMKGFKVILLKN